MSKIIYKDGDFLEGPEKFVLHGCNSMGVMGSGAAKAVRAKYQSAYETYMDYYHDYGLHLGDFNRVTVDGVTIFNCITQEFYGRDPRVLYVDYGAVERCMVGINAYMRTFVGEFEEIAMPAIGCGLGNGDWNIISQIIEEESKYFQPIVYIL